MFHRDITHFFVGLVAILVVLPTLFSGVAVAQGEEDIEITVTDSKYGEDSETVPIVIDDGDSTIPTDFPADGEQYNAIIDEYGEISPITLAQLITDNAEQGDVGGVEFSPIELAEIVDWNAGQ
jgi:hypothetical protein